MCRRVVHFPMKNVPDRNTTLFKTFENREVASTLIKMLKIYDTDMRETVKNHAFWTTAASLQVARDFRTVFLTQANMVEDLLRSRLVQMSPLVAMKVRCIEKDDRGLTPREAELLRANYVPFSESEAALSRGEAPQYGYKIRDTIVTETNMITLDELVNCFRRYCSQKGIDCPAVDAKTFMERFARYGIKNVSSKIAVYFVGISKGALPEDEGRGGSGSGGGGGGGGGGGSGGSGGSGSGRRHNKRAR